jgi:predicted RNA binding protein YcfA (HicA-like mRNA interferase family)
MPSATARELQSVARKLGFSRIRQTGSHERWNHTDGRAVTSPSTRAARLVLLFSSKFFDSSAFPSTNFNSFGER